VAKRIGFLDDVKTKEVDGLLNEVMKMLNAYTATRM
jgi:hypothetical protein